jgi:hypothetical protein
LSSLPRRMWGAARLDADTYEEVEADHRSLVQAALLVVVACAAAACGTLSRSSGAPLSAVAQAVQVAVAGLLPAVLWVGGSAFAYMVGATFLRGPETETDFAEVLRTTGFAFTPGLLLAGTALPGMAGLWVFYTGWLWIVVAGVVAIRQALDFTTPRAVATFGSAALLLWLVVWGLAVVPLPFPSP